MSIGQKIRLARKAADLSIAEAARKIGATRQQWHQWEADVHTPGWDTMRRIAGALNMTAIELATYGDTSADTPEEISEEVAR